MRKRLLLISLLLLLTLPASTAQQGQDLTPQEPIASMPQASDAANILDNVSILSIQDHAAWNGTGLPAWTYELYCIPFLRMSLFKRADPVNLVFDLPYDIVRSQLKRYGWKETSRWNIIEANINYLPNAGFMRPQAANFFLDSYNGTRYHLRLWNMGGTIVGQAHLDTSVPHMAYGYEQAEVRVARAFFRYRVQRNACSLHNACYDEKGYYCNGWATIIKYK